MKSIQFMMMRHGHFVGFCYINPNESNPQDKAREIGNRWECTSASNPLPSDKQPQPYVCLAAKEK